MGVRGDQRWLPRLRLPELAPQKTTCLLAVLMAPTPPPRYSAPPLPNPPPPRPRRKSTPLPLTLTPPRGRLGDVRAHAAAVRPLSRDTAPHQPRDLEWDRLRAGGDPDHHDATAVGDDVERSQYGLRPPERLERDVDAATAGERPHHRRG